MSAIDRCCSGRRRTLGVRIVLLLALFAIDARSRTAGADPARTAPRGGTIDAEVVLGSKLAQRRMTFELYPDLRRKTAPQAAAPEIENVVVFVEGLERSVSAAAGAKHVMEQRDGAFVPHVLAVPRGSTVEFPNSDVVYHNVFSLSRTAPFDLGRYPRGESRAVRFDEPGVVKVFCHIHSDMSAAVVVLPNPYFSRPDSAGRLRIDGVPAGEHTLVAWHERAPRTTRIVRVVDGQAARVRFEIPLLDPPADDGR